MIGLTKGDLGCRKTDITAALDDEMFSAPQKANNDSIIIGV